MQGTSAEAQLDALYEEREQLTDTLGVADAQSLIDMVRSLEAQLQTLYDEKERQPQGSSAPAAGNAASADPSLQMQLEDLYAQREVLERELGCSMAESVVSMTRSLETQLQDMYQDRESGAAEAAAVVQRIRRIADEIGSGYREAELVYENEAGPSRWAVTWRHA